MNRRLMFAAVLVLSVLITSPAWRLPQDKRDIQAIMIKVVRDVKKSTTQGWQEAIPGDRLRSGQQVRTDDKSIALIRFTDESKLIVREKSIVEIKGTVAGKQILDRSVHMTRGKLAFNVKKAEQEQFRFSSPISVASIRGTEGSFATLDSLDILIILRGLASLTNLISNQSQDVGSGQTGITGSDGSVNVRPSTQGETSDATYDESQTQGESGKVRKVLRIPGEDKDGNPKTIIVEWEE
jgi:hypothetical protein